MRLKLLSGEQLLFLANVICDRLFFKSHADASIKNILVVKWDEIGDMATSTHVFALLRQNYPEALITVLCKPFVRELILYDTSIDKIITDINDYNKKHDLVIELRGTWKTLQKSLWFKGKFRVSRAAVRFRNKGRQLQEIDTNTAIVRPMLKNIPEGTVPKLYFSKEDEATVNKYLELHGIKKYAILHVGARRVLRQWKLDRFAEAAKHLHEKHGFEIIFAGSSADHDHINEVRSLIKFPTFEFADGFSLSEFSCLCEGAGFYLGNESGPLHIASVFEVPLLGLYGPGVPHVFYPRSPKSAVLHHVLPCNPCDQIHCVHPENPCINRIPVSDVNSKIDQILMN